VYDWCEEEGKCLNSDEFMIHADGKCNGLIYISLSVYLKVTY